MTCWLQHSNDDAEQVEKCYSINWKYANCDFCKNNYYCTSEKLLMLHNLDIGHWKFKKNCSISTLINTSAVIENWILNNTAAQVENWILWTLLQNLKIWNCKLTNAAQFAWIVWLPQFASCAMRRSMQPGSYQERVQHISSVIRGQT